MKDEMYISITRNNIRRIPFPVLSKLRNNTSVPTDRIEHGVENIYVAT